MPVICLLTSEPLAYCGEALTYLMPSFYRWWILMNIKPGTLGELPKFKELQLLGGASQLSLILQQASLGLFTRLALEFLLGRDSLYLGKELDLMSVGAEYWQELMLSKMGCLHGSPCEWEKLRFLPEVGGLKRWHRIRTRSGGEAEPGQWCMTENDGPKGQCTVPWNGLTEDVWITRIRNVILKFSFIVVRSPPTSPPTSSYDICECFVSTLFCF